MSAGVSPLSASGPSALMGERAPPSRAGVAFAPSGSAPSTADGALHLPDEQAFKVSTINERLARTAAGAETAGRLDITA
jgi:hypothetical protein